MTSKQHQPEIQVLIDDYDKPQQTHQAHQADLSTVKGQLAALREKGEDWREGHTNTKRHRDGSTTEDVPKVPARKVADIVKEICTFTVLGKTDQELEYAPLRYYNPDLGLYVQDQRTIQKLILAVENSISAQNRNEIMRWLRIEATPKQEEQSPYLVPVGNGYFDTRTKTLHPFSPDHVFTKKTATNYNPDATEPNFNGWTFSGWIKELAGDVENKETLLWQAIRTTVTPLHNAEVMFLLVDDGQGRTGKSTFVETLINLVGIINTTALNLVDFDNDFKLASGYGAMLIVGDDNNPNGVIYDGSALKTIVTNGTLVVNQKYQPPFTAHFNTTVIQNMNGIPTFRDVSGGMLRRFRVINFPKQYAATPENAKIKEEYTKDPRLLEWILKEALTYDAETIVDTPESRKIVHDTKLDNDPVARFVENCLPQLKSDRVPMRFLFNYFLSVADQENQHKPGSQNRFTHALKKVLPATGEWEYSKNNLALLDYFDMEDLNLIENPRRSDGTDYRGQATPTNLKSKQPLLVRQPKSNQKTTEIS